jgi:hypothetical protein
MVNVLKYGVARHLFTVMIASEYSGFKWHITNREEEEEGDRHYIAMYHYICGALA